MSLQRLAVSTLGFPRIGAKRELKKALEAYWSGQMDETGLLAEAARLRRENWLLQQAHGVRHIPSNDASLYDHVLDTSVMVGAIPERYGWVKDTPVTLDTYFAMARGTRAQEAAIAATAPLEMKKWFDTNYHFMVPEFSRHQSFTLASNKPVDDFVDAKSIGIHTRPVLLGPITYLSLGKMVDGGDRLSLLPHLIPVYAELLTRLRDVGADWVQLDEPALVLETDDRVRAAFDQTYQALAAAVPEVKILLATYFGTIGEPGAAVRLPVAGLHVDLVRGANQLELLLRDAPKAMVLSLGVVDGRNVWRADLDTLAARLIPAVERRGSGNLWLAPSCSLLHVPVDLGLETGLDPALKDSLAFAMQKLDELKTLSEILDGHRRPVSRPAPTRRTAASDPAVQDRLARITPEMTHRQHGFAERQDIQRQQLGLPLFPTTTIGSFPQTADIRETRAAHARGAMADAAYDAFLRKAIAEAIAWQENIGLDVLVHGEFERNDMVQYFAERLSGFATTQHGWMQSYGSRCVKPPIIHADVSRPAPISVSWTLYAQSLTRKPVKAMLTGPVTMLQWSFVRDDLSRADVCRQIALALRDEVADLEHAKIRMIQMDEPALREGLPLRRADWPSYLAWAAECFRLASSGVQDETQIHTHMCYSQFSDIIEHIALMDADVISIETARSNMELLEAFADYRYPNEIGPGIYDVHAPNAPSVAQMVELLERAAARLPPENIWVNPDCGLKTRSWNEIRPALANMVRAAEIMRIRRGRSGAATQT